MHTKLSRNLALALLPTIGLLIALSLYFKVPLDLSFAVLATCGASFYVAARIPEILLVAVMFAPQWKTYWPLSRVDGFVDLTVAAAACLAAGVACRLLGFGRGKDWNLRRFLFRQQRTLIAYLLFAAVIAFSYSYTTAPTYGFSKLTRFLFIGTLLFLAPCFLILSEMDFRRFVLIFLGASVITTMEMIAHLETRTDANVDITRIGAGWLLGMAVIIVLFYPLFPRKAVQSTFVALALPFLAAGLIASAARGAIVSVIPVTLIGAILWIKQGRLSVRTALLLLALLVASATAAYFVLRQTDLDKYTAKASELVNLVTGHAVSGSAAKRLPFYETALRAIPDHLLLGRGIGSWAMFYFGSDQRDYPHDLVLELLFEEGLLGLTAFGVFLLSLAISAVAMLRFSRLHFLVVPMMVLYCVNVSMFSGDLDDNRLIWLWAGMTLAVCRMVSLERLARSRATAPRSIFLRRLDSASLLPHSRSVIASPSTTQTGGMR